MGRGSPFIVSYQNCCKKNIYVNDSQNLAFATSHFVIELLPFDYLSNQKQWVNKKMHFKRNNSSHTCCTFSTVEFFCRSLHAEHFCSLIFPSISNSFWKMKVLKFRTFWWKKGNNSKMGNQIYFKIAGYVDLAVLIILPQSDFWYY